MNDRQSTPAEALYADAANTVLYDVTDGVCVITLNRPQRRNGITPGMHRRYYDVLKRAEQDPEARAIVVTGAGGTFSPGADTAVMVGGGGREVRREFREGTGYPPHYSATIRKPMIASLEGAVAGLGFVFAASCDVRFAAAGTKFATSFSRRGLAAEYGVAWILPRLIGHANALDLLLSGRTFLADEAQRLGFVQHVVAEGRALESALTYARELAQFSSPTSMAIIKEQVLAAYTQDATTAAEQSVVLMHEALRRSDFVEGFASFTEKRPPVFASYATGQIESGPISADATVGDETAAIHPGS